MKLQDPGKIDIDVEKLKARAICFIYQMLVFITINWRVHLRAIVPLLQECGLTT